MSWYSISLSSTIRLFSGPHRNQTIPSGDSCPAGQTQLLIVKENSSGTFLKVEGELWEQQRAVGSRMAEGSGSALSSHLYSKNLGLNKTHLSGC